MTDVWMLVVSLVIGLALGAAYFGGLWLVVRRLNRLAAPAVWLGVGVVLRLVLVLAGLYLVMDGRWERLVAAVAGLLLARTAAMAMARRGLPGRTHP